MSSLARNKVPENIENSLLLVFVPGRFILKKRQFILTYMNHKQETEDRLVKKIILI